MGIKPVTHILPAGKTWRKYKLWSKVNIYLLQASIGRLQSLYFLPKCIELTILGNSKKITVSNLAVESGLDTRVGVEKHDIKFCNEVVVTTQVDIT